MAGVGGNESSDGAHMKNDDGASWSFITGAQLANYGEQASRLFEEIVRFAKSNDIHPFAAGLCAAMLVRVSNSMMDGNLDWWLEVIKDPEVLYEKYCVQLPPGFTFAGKPGQG